MVISAPEPKAQVHYCDHALSVVRPSSETTEQNSTKLDRIQELNIFYQVCFLGRSEKQDGRPGLWIAETFSTSPQKPLNGIQRNSIGSKISMSSTKFVFSGRSEKQDGRPSLWFAETFSTSPLKPLNGIQRNLTGSKISTSSAKFVFFGPIGKTRWPPWPLIGWDIFDFPSETAEQNSTKLDRTQDLNVLYQVCVFRADRKKQDGRPGFWLAETFSTSPLKPLNGNQENLAGSKISTSSTKFVFFGPMGKTRWPPWLRQFWLLPWNRLTEFKETWQESRSQSPLPSLCFFGLIGKIRWPPLPLIGWDIFDFSSETAERNSKKLDRKQDLNSLYQVCVFRADE